MTPFFLILVTVPDEETGLTLARTLVTEELAACANLVPGLRSIYRWEGKIQDDQELLLLIKTSRTCWERLLERVLALHPYETPEVIGLPIEQGAPEYLHWLAS